ISPSGKITGMSSTSSVFNARAYLKDGTTMIQLGTLGGDYSEGFGVNDAGQVAGNSKTASGITHAFLYENGTMNDLGTLGGSTSLALGTNASGQVVGSSVRADDFNHAFLYSGG